MRIAPKSSSHGYLGLALGLAACSGELTGPVGKGSPNGTPTTGGATNTLPGTGGGSSGSVGSGGTSVGSGGTSVGSGGTSVGTGGTSVGSGGTSAGTGGTPPDSGPPAAPEGTIPNDPQPPDKVGIPKDQWPDGLISPTLESEHHNQPSVINGYLQLTGNSRFSIYDISDPTAPEQLSVSVSPQECCGEAEGHQVSFAKYGSNFYTVTIQGHGVDIWDITDVRNPEHLKSVNIEGINFGDFTEAVWGVSWQGTTIYVGGTNTGLHVIDATDPANATLVGRLANVGGVNAGPLFAIGNILVVTTPKDNAGIATVDISNPHNPLILDSVSPTGVSYIGGFYRHHAFLLNPIRVYDVLSDPTEITSVQTNGVGGYFEYMSFQDGHMFGGRIRPEPGATKINIQNIGQMSFVRDIYGRRNLQENDDQFTVAIGPLLVMSDDQLSPATNQYAGTVIGVHDTAPDTTPPSVDTVMPRDGATSQPVTSRIGISFTDNIELATVDSRSFIVRPVGGQALNGTWGVTMSVLSFDPEGTLQPGTTYEIILPAGGVTDYVGNGIAAEFRSTFTTQ